MSCHDRQRVAFFMPSYRPDGRGGKVRSWKRHRVFTAPVSLRNVREAETGRLLSSQQEGTVKVPRSADVREGFRARLGGVEFEVVGVDPKMPSPQRRVFIRRVEHEEIGNG